MPTLTKDGYLQHATRDSKRNRLDHRVIWEAHFGPIPVGFVVHHKNGDTADNSVDNLVLMTNAEHSKLHVMRQIAEGKVSLKFRGHGHKAGAEHPNWLKLPEDELLRLRLAGCTMYRLAKIFGTNHQTIKRHLEVEHVI